MDGTRHGLPRSNVKKYKRKAVLPLPPVVEEIVEEEVVQPMTTEEMERMLNRILKTAKADDAA